MELLDRYLAEIRRNLPSDKADDIVAEIGDELQSQIDEGRDPVEAIRAYGMPITVAARYKGQQYLVGPQLMPFFWRAFGALLVAVWLFELNVGHVLKTPPFSNAFDLMFHSVVWVFAATVILFTVLQHAVGEARIGAWFAKWDPKRLPPAVDDRFYVPFRVAAPELIVNFSVFYVFVSLVPWFKTLGLAPWSSLQYAAYGLAVSTILVATAALMTLSRPAWGRVRIAVHVLGYLLVAGGFGMTLYGGVTNAIFGYGLMTGIGVCAVAIAFELRTLLVPKPKLQMLV